MLAILISFSNLFILVPVVTHRPPTFQTDLSPQGAGPALVWHAAFRGRLVKEIKVKGKGGIMSKSLRVSLGAKDSRTPHVSKKSHPSPSLPLSHVFHCLDLTPASGCTICIQTLIQTLDYKNKTWAHFDNCIWGRLQTIVVCVLPSLVPRQGLFLSLNILNAVCYLFIFDKIIWMMYVWKCNCASETAQVGGTF